MNPILPNQYYIPDAEARVWEDGRVYLYGSKDIAGDDYYCSREYQVFASRDLQKWEAGGVSFSTQALREKTQGRLYAPDCIEKDGRYYLLYCLADGREGIAESENPMGPFRDKGTIPGVCGIDPCALVEGDTVYYFWGQMDLHGAKLDLKTGTIDEESHVHGLLTQERDGFHEGSSIRKIGEKYYLVYTDISRGRATCMGYAVSDRPLGPYEKKGILIDNTGCDPKSWNDHGSIEQIGGRYYVFYHRSTHGSEFSRRVCVEPLTVHEDGTIDEAEMTSQGAEPYLPCTRELPASAFCLLCGQAYLADYTAGKESFSYLTNIHAGDGAYVKYYRFDTPVRTLTVWAANGGAEALVRAHLDGPEGPVIAETVIGRTEGGFDFQPFTGVATETLDGYHAVYLEFVGEEGRLMNVKGIAFRE